ncbi:alpha/beta hydrolase [Oceanimonas smirnovii]|uniref:alpha/beta hydrolase n=1 Tax=Oceanimonas smirnovii TaxID=264574 RepID=UPI003FD281BB
MRYWKLLLITLLLTPACASSPQTEHYRYQQLDFQSRDGRREYRVTIGLPTAAAPEGGYPVLYMLDGTAALKGLTQSRLSRLQGGDWPVLVTIAYHSDARTGRTFDYTPVPANAVTEHEYGGADGFWKLIEDEIKPAVGRAAAVNPERQTLWGHSFGGLFVLHTLFHYPESYQRYVAADPSLWWQGGQLLHAEKAYRERQQWPAITLLLQRSSSHRRGSTVPENATRNMARRLSELPAMAVQYTDYFNHHHGSVRDVSIPTALSMAQQ